MLGGTTLSDLRNAFLAIGIPTYGNITENFLNFCNELVTLLHTVNMRYVFLTKEGSLICRARNQIMSGFYDLCKGSNGDYYKELTHFLFLDCDVSTDPRHIVQMIGHTYTYDVDLIGAYVPLKDFMDNVLQKTRAFKLNIDSDAPEVFIDSDKTLQKVDILTTGMLMFTKKMVFELIKDAKKNGDWYHYDVDSRRRLYNPFKTPIIEEMRGGKKFRHYLSEDWYICYKARELGFDVIADRSINVKHRGHFDFRFPAREDFDAIMSAENHLMSSGFGKVLNIRGDNQ